MARGLHRVLPRIGAILAIALVSGACSNEHFLVGDSYVALMAPYAESHTHCPTRDYSRNSRRAADVLVEDLDVIAADVAALGENERPVVILSVGAVDEALWGPDLAALLVTELARELLALDPELELLHLEYLSDGSSPLRFWRQLPYDEEPRWHRVRFPDVVDASIGNDGVHLPLPGYVERLFSLARQFPEEMLCRNALLQL